MGPLTREQVVHPFWKSCTTKEELINALTTNASSGDSGKAMKRDVTDAINRAIQIARADIEAQLKSAQEEHINQMSAVQLRLAEMKDQLALAEQRTAEACAAWCEDRMRIYETGGFVREFTAVRTARNSFCADEWRKFIKEN